MPPTFSEIPTLAVWEPVHPDDWGPGEAKHFLERAGFAATPEALEEATDLGASECCRRFFPTVPFPVPEWISEKFSTFEKLTQEAKDAEDRDSRREIYRNRSQIQREVLVEFEYEWLLRASQPENGFRAKWELFLSDVWVIDKRSVRHPEWMTAYWQSLAGKSDIPYPQFCKDFSREPAMVQYLDLNRSSKEKPNENFARELMELFTLGEGNYTESDIKEAARAFTGRRLYQDRYREIEKQMDTGRKTLFSRSGTWDGDDVIDLIFTQPTARTFLPSEAIRFYLTREKIPEERLRFLGDLWAEEGFQLDALRNRLFASRGFYASDFCGNQIKSPIEFYLGSLQRLGLQPAPLAQRTSRPLRDMGQELFQPPNVRGWIGGEAWINAGKIAARRQTATSFFEPLPMGRLNADDQLRIEREQERSGCRPFHLDPSSLVAKCGESPDQIVRFINEQLLAVPTDSHFEAEIRSFLGPNPNPEKIETTILTVLQSPSYQLC